MSRRESLLYNGCWGVARAEEAELPPGALWERVFPVQGGPSRRARRQTLFGTFDFIRPGEPEALWEKQSILLEAARRFGSLACVVSAPGGWVARMGAERAVRALAERWRREAGCPLYFDFGQYEPPGWLDPAETVTDPLWGDGKIRGDYWRVHGWHTQRWIRLYGQADLTRLRRKAERHRPLALVLCHSMRVQQWSELQALRIV